MANRAEYEATCRIVDGLSPHLTQSTYACGGSVPLQSRKDEEDASPPTITVRWDDGDSNHRLEFPVNDENPNRMEQLKKLQATAAPASFGYKGEDIIDESYRRASKIDPSRFSTDFCPYVSGIIDSVAQNLLPLPGNTAQGIRAELYKMNIYAAPNGMFKPHVDTPRSELQFGSLVVCLPCQHEGGQLLVRHQDHETMFDWSNIENSVKWAAFFSDCEHEIKEVVSGQRITLTYNLYWRHSAGELAGRQLTLDISQYPAYKEVQAALKDRNFYPSGGVLSKYCSHAYVHTTQSGITALPGSLKGSDMLTFEIFRVLGAKVNICPVLDTTYFDFQRYDESYSDDDEHADIEGSDAIFMPLMGVSDVGQSYDEDCPLEMKIADVHHSHYKTIWMNLPTKSKEEIQMAHIAYGNQAELQFEYSRCALLIDIPSYSERVKDKE